MANTLGNGVMLFLSFSQTSGHSLTISETSEMKNLTSPVIDSAYLCLRFWYYVSPSSITPSLTVTELGPRRVYGKSGESGWKFVQKPITASANHSRKVVNTSQLERFKRDNSALVRWLPCKTPKPQARGRVWDRNVLCEKAHMLFLNEKPPILGDLHINPFTSESDQCQNSPAASQEIWHHTVWRTWLFIAYSDEKWLYYKFSLHHSYTRFLKGWENTLFELRSERVKEMVVLVACTAWTR